MRRTDAITGAVLTIIGLVTIVFVIPAEIESGDEFGLPASFLPNLFMAALTALAALLTLSGLLGKRGADEAAPMSAVAWRHLVLIAGLLAATLLVMVVAGFLIGGACAIAAFMAYQGERRLWLIGLTAIVAAGLIYLSFRHGLGVVLI